MIFVTVAGLKVDYTGLQWSSVDPGGFESCSFSVHTKNSGLINAGDEIEVWDGNEMCWHGFVEEPGFRYEGGESVYNVGGVGYSALLNQNPFNIIYIDRRLNEFGTTPLEREITLANAGFVLNDSGGVDVRAGETSTASGGYPALVLAFDNYVSTAARHPIVESWYDAGMGNAIGSVMFDYETYDKGSGGINSLNNALWLNIFFGTGAPSGSSSNSTTGNLGTDGSATLETLANDQRYVAAQLYFNGAIATGDGDWKWMLYNVRIIGIHGLTLRGVAPYEGFYTSDIIRDAVIRSKARFDLQIDDSNTYVVQQAAYKEVVPPAQIITETNNLIGWHWGVWEPAKYSPLPRFLYCAPPESASLFANYFDCRDIDISQKFSESFNRAVVHYSLPNGLSRYVTVTKDNPSLSYEVENTVQIDIGNAGSDDAAETIGLYQLSLLQDNARIAGSLTLPPSLKGTPSHLIRPGLEKIKLVNIPAYSTSFSPLDIQANTFRIKRLSVTVTNEIPVTQIEFDHGADLIEVMQARLANAVEARNVG